jgi:uncharacterized protein YabE (DUF348 family)
MIIKNTKALTVSEFLLEQGVEYGENDFITPPINTPINNRDTIIIWREKEISIADGKNNFFVSTYSDNVANLLIEEEIKLREEDLISPGYYAPIDHKDEIVITRVEIREEVEEESIGFEKNGD